MMEGEGEGGQLMSSPVQPNEEAAGLLLWRMGE